MLFWVAIAGVGALFLAHTAPFPFLIDTLNGTRAVWKMPADGRRLVYLTFDDGPNPDATPALLDVLARERVHATFFLIDRYVTPETAPIVQRLFDEGHAVALHSDTKRLIMLPPDELARTLRGQAARIEQLAGHRPCPLFRPHGGWRSAAMYDGLRSIDHRLVGWGWLMFDWNFFRAREPVALARRFTARASPGSIIVMHDGHHVNPRADRRYTVETIRQLVPALRAKGFEFGAMCDPRAPKPPGL
jgi:peptidoglycan/xylan/chitin deacetylase (PgdA/CDA1 family)